MYHCFRQAYKWLIRTRVPEGPFSGDRGHDHGSLETKEILLFEKPFGKALLHRDSGNLRTLDLPWNEVGTSTIDLQ